MTERVYADRQAIATLIAGGAKDLKLPDPDEERAKLDKTIAQPHGTGDRRQHEWRQAMRLVPYDRTG
jgi:hypothetical protein